MLPYVVSMIQPKHKISPFTSYNMQIRRQDKSMTWQDLRKLTERALTE